LDEIRSDPKLKEIPVVIFSTSSNVDTIKKSYSKGASYYICKPPSFKLLVKAIETVLALDLWNTPQSSEKEFVMSIA
jgi:CheY-like chemotaxis protein